MIELNQHTCMHGWIFVIAFPFLLQLFLPLKTQLLLQQESIGIASCSFLLQATFPIQKVAEKLLLCIYQLKSRLARYWQMTAGRVSLGR